jgi:hypothetical protein
VEGGDIRQGPGQSIEHAGVGFDGDDPVGPLDE